MITRRWPRSGPRPSIPIAAGESEFTRYGFRDMIDAGAVDFVQPDVAIAGGITECRRISALASAYGKLFSPHGGSSGVLIAASLHLAASSPNCNIFAVSPGPNPFVDQLIEEPFKVKDGYVEVLEGPGLGHYPGREVREAIPVYRGTLSHYLTGVRVPHATPERRRSLPATRNISCWSPPGPPRIEWRASSSLPP